MASYVGRDLSDKTSVSIFVPMRGDHLYPSPLLGQGQLQVQWNRGQRAAKLAATPPSRQRGRRQLIHIWLVSREGNPVNRAGHVESLRC